MPQAGPVHLQHQQQQHQARWQLQQVAWMMTCSGGDDMQGMHQRCVVEEQPNAVASCVFVPRSHHSKVVCNQNGCHAVQQSSSAASAFIQKLIMDAFFAEAHWVVTMTLHVG
jgi:hypothetical protein